MFISLDLMESQNKLSTSLTHEAFISQVMSDTQDALTQRFKKINTVKYLVVSLQQ